MTRQTGNWQEFTVFQQLDSTGYYFLSSQCTSRNAFLRLTNRQPHHLHPTPPRPAAPTLFIPHLLNIKKKDAPLHTKFPKTFHSIVACPLIIPFLTHAIVLHRTPQKYSNCACCCNPNALIFLFAMGKPNENREKEKNRKTKRVM